MMQENDARFLFQFVFCQKGVKKQESMLVDKVKKIKK